MLSPDESLLYVNDTEQANIRVFEVTPEGGLRQRRRIFASWHRDSLVPRRAPTGMKCDAEGNVGHVRRSGLWVYAPSEGLIGKVAIPESGGELSLLAGRTGAHALRLLRRGRSTAIVRGKVRPRNEAFMRARPRGKRRCPHRVRGDGEAPAASTPGACALIIQDMQNDVVMEGGAFAASGSPRQTGAEQGARENIARLARRCRELGVAGDPRALPRPAGREGPDAQRAAVSRACSTANALVRRHLGREPAPGCEVHDGDHVRRQDAQCFGLRGHQPPRPSSRRRGGISLIETGAWTNMSIEHTARTGGRQGLTSW